MPVVASRRDNHGSAGSQLFAAVSNLTTAVRIMPGMPLPADTGHPVKPVLFAYRCDSGRVQGWRHGLRDRENPIIGQIIDEGIDHVEDDDRQIHHEGVPQAHA